MTVYVTILNCCKWHCIHSNIVSVIGWVFSVSYKNICYLSSKTGMDWSSSSNVARSFRYVEIAFVICLEYLIHEYVAKEQHKNDGDQVILSSCRSIPAFQGYCCLVKLLGIYRVKLQSLRVQSWLVWRQTKLRFNSTSPRDPFEMCIDHWGQLTRSERTLSFGEPNKILGW